MTRWDAFMLVAVGLGLAAIWLLHRIARQLGAAPELIAWLRSLGASRRR